MGVGNLTISGKPKLRSRLPVMVLALAASQKLAMVGQDFLKFHFSMAFPSA